MSRAWTFISISVLLIYSAAAVVTADGKNCSCGFYDTGFRRYYTDSIVVYFNETNNFSEDFLAGDYEHKYEKDWNALYRQSAHPVNVRSNGSNSLELSVSPPTEHHVVKGAEIHTIRHDIQHGSFRAYIKPPQHNFSGSALSMLWIYNDTETAEISVMNTNEFSQAWVGTFVNGEFPTRNHGVNFSTALDSADANRNYTVMEGSPSDGHLDLWDYTEYRIDWSNDTIDFFSGGNLSRSVSHSTQKGYPSVPSAIYFKHWSTGNIFSMQGPPAKTSVANVAWIRMFFNSSSFTAEAQDELRTRCSIEHACLVDDISLRGSTPYPELAQKKWKQSNNKSAVRMPALWASVVCIAFSFLLLLHAFIRRPPWRKQFKTSGACSTPSLGNDVATDKSPSGCFNDRDPFVQSDSHSDSFNISSSNSSAKLPPSNDEVKESQELFYEKAERGKDATISNSSKGESSHTASSFSSASLGVSPRASLPYPKGCDNTNKEKSERVSRSPRLDLLTTHPKRGSERTIEASFSSIPTTTIRTETIIEASKSRLRTQSQPPSSRERVDHLAGVVAICAILVTVMHFGLTFVPAMIIPGAPLHHKSEFWAQQLISPFILNQMWLGVFFTTSVRFLVASYLKKGNMQDIAKAAVRRTPRLMIPVAAIALLEYFLVDIGATTYLRYIPSITWSTWPYVTRFPTIGHFVSEVLELIFLIPNAVPQITYNYCTGVLWTITVQLQGSWLVLCGVIVVYEIKSPWKRTAYYIFVLVNHWYAQSWGSYLWFGLLLTDLDITYDYKSWLHSRPLAYYPLLVFCWLGVAAGFAANMIPGWINFGFPTYEHDIHPDTATGEPLWNTVNAGYPPYYIPRLYGLLFAAGVQAAVELSPSVQWFLSLPFFLVLFPHIFTLYLIHGLVFWTWGSWLMIFLAERNFHYSSNVTIVGVTSFVVLFLCLPIVTPIIEALGKDITALVWMSATKEPPPRRQTLFPFPEDFLARREKNDVEAGQVGCGRCHEKSQISSELSSGGDKGKKKREVTETRQPDSRSHHDSEV